MSNQVVVMNPMGYPPTITQQGMAPRPASLEEGPTYLVDCRFDDGDKLIEQMRNWFADNMPQVHTEVRGKVGVYYERDNELYEEIRQKGGTAVVAVGH